MTPPRLLAARRLAAALLAVLLAGLAAAAPAAAQQPVPRNPDAELVFEQGVAAFESGNYAKAYERFRLVDDYALNRKTTAALLMGGKALYRMGRYRDAVDRLTRLRERYPQSTYRDEAQAVADAARQALQRYGQSADTLRVGIVLPLTDQDAQFTQALFNGIRLAVDEHNGVRRRYLPPPGLRAAGDSAAADSFDVFDTAEVYGDSLARADGRTTVATRRDTVQVDSQRILTERVRRPDWIAKMAFRSAGGTPEGARAAVDSLVRLDDADVVIGPLYSRTARAAGEVAERSRVVMVAPLATQESVSAGRRYVFQSNPTIPLRGRIMAEFASQSLLTKTAGIVYEEGGGESGGMARGFREEAQRQGLKVNYTIGLESTRDWSRLPEVVESDSTLTDSLLAATDAVYLPMAGRNAAGKIQDALTGFERLQTGARVLGNAQWHDLSVKQAASNVRATYANDFYVRSGRPEVQRYVRNYRLLTGQTPDDLSVTARRLAFTGYDVARFLLTTLTPSTARPEPAALRQAPRYDGLGIRINFREGNVNRAMFFHRYRSGRLELLR
jgi:ABC-type branched-subunit amino acid transport system substrate-binding protein